MIDTSEILGMSPKQKAAFAGSDGRVNIWDGSVRSGKTYAWTLLMLMLIAKYTGSAAIVISGKNRDSIYRNVFEPIESLPIFIPVRKYVHYTQGAAKATIFGHFVHIIGANDAGAESKIRGMTIGLAFADEITLLHVTFVKQLFSRLSKSYSKLYATTNPDSQNHWLRKEYLTRIPGCMHYDPHTEPENQLTDWTYWHFTMDDNPSLTTDYKENLKKEYVGMWYRRFILGLWVAAEGAIYQMWDEDKYVIRPEDMPPMKRTLALGIDYGTTHPTVGILLGLGEDNKLYALDEWLPGRLTDKALSESLREFRESHPQPDWVYVDPAAASFSLQLHEDGHRRVDKANNDVLDGIRTVASLLDNEQLFISSTCTKLIEELPGYRWDEKAADKGIDKPIKEIDDACLVAGTLIQTPTGQKRIEELCAGDYITMPDGNHRVAAAAMTNPAATVRTLHLSNGQSITGTLNHPILVNNEWVPLGNIQQGQQLTSWHAPKPSSTVASNFAATQTPTTNPTAATLSPASTTNKTALTTSTAKSGVITMTGQKSQTATTSTTSIMTTATTGRKTSCWSMAANTSRIMRAWTTKIRSIAAELSTTLTGFAPSLNSGTPATRGANGTPSTGQAHWVKRLWNVLACVNSAETNTPLATRTSVTDSVATSARPHGDEHPASMMSNAPVPTAGKNSPATSTPRLRPVPVHVVGLSDEVKGQRVYNLTIEGKHQYIANGLITHNCDALRYSVFSSRYMWSRFVQ